MIRGHILVFDGFDELDVIGPFEVFATAAEAGADVVVTLASPSSRRSAVGAYGLEVSGLADPDTSQNLNLVVVPGGNWITRSKVGAWGEVQRGDIFPLLTTYAEHPGMCLATVCTGSLILAHAGLANGRTITTHPAAFEDLARLDIRVALDRVVDDGPVVTCGGVLSGIDLALSLLARFEGEAIAADVARRLDHRWTRATPARVARIRGT